MTISFRFGSTLTFSSPINALGHVQKTFMFNISYHNTNNGWRARIFDGTGTDSDEYFEISFAGGSTSTLEIKAHFSTTNGLWRVQESISTFSGSFIVTYNGGSVSNNPLLYRNGSSISLTKITTPVGTYRVGTGSNLIFEETYNKSFDLSDVRIYNVIKTPTQCANIADEDIETDAVIDESGLVFHAPLTMCKLLTYDTFVGSTLGASNEFLDRINGYIGVPAGSPIGA